MCLGVLGTGFHAIVFPMHASLCRVWERRCMKDLSLCWAVPRFGDLRSLLKRIGFAVRFAIIINCPIEKVEFTMPEN